MIYSRSEIGTIKPDTRKFWHRYITNRDLAFFFIMESTQNFSHAEKVQEHKGDSQPVLRNKKIVRFRIVEGTLTRAMAELCHCYSWHT